MMTKIANLPIKYIWRLPESLGVCAIFSGYNNITH